MTDRLAHPPHLAVAALVDRRARSIRPRRPIRRTRAGAVSPSSSRTPVAQRSQRRLANRPAADARPVGLGHLVARMGQQVGELAVVGQQDQPAAVGVQAPDRIQARDPSPGTARRRSGGHGCRARSRRRRAACCTAYTTLLLGPRQRASVELDAVALANIARRVGSRPLRSTQTRPARDQRLSRPRREATPAWARCLARRIYSGVGPPPARASPARRSRSRSSACSSGVGSQRATSGSSSSQRSPNSFRNSVLVR